MASHCSAYRLTAGTEGRPLEEDSGFQCSTYLVFYLGRCRVCLDHLQKSADELFMFVLNFASGVSSTNRDFMDFASFAS